jgi:putative tryptophan/tyrosine transport system substrate-binding protein
MRRREFITLLGGAAAWPQRARAQQTERVRRIGVLMSMDESDSEGQAHLAGFMQALLELGWVRGRNLEMEIRWGAADVNRIRTFAKELTALQPELIVSQGTPVTAALQRETRSIPIVFVTVTDPVGDGFVTGLARPDGNITGFLTSESGITAKMLELLMERPRPHAGRNVVQPGYGSRWRQLLLSRF